MGLKKPTTRAIAPSQAEGQLTADVVATGLPVPAVDRLRLMSPSEWEDFITEWVDSLRDAYALVEKFAGAGDMGCDVVATHLDDETQWDNYQCKHYDHALHPSEIWVELGKLVYYAHAGEFTYPSAYHFVAPSGVGPKLSRLLKKPDKLKQDLIESWDKHCKSQICSEPVPLEGDLRLYLDGLDFSIFSAAPPLKVLEAHATTRWHVARFGGGLPKRPEPLLPPPTIANDELQYVQQLLAAYSDHLGCGIVAIQAISDEDLLAHFNDSRLEFYSAESLRLFSRETLPPHEFGNLQREVLDGIRDEWRSQHPDAYAKVLSVVKTAKALPLNNHPLVTRVMARDKGGICHQLANDLEIRWIK